MMIFKECPFFEKSLTHDLRGGVYTEALASRLLISQMDSEPQVLSVFSENDIDAVFFSISEKYEKVRERRKYTGKNMQG